MKVLDWGEEGLATAAEAAALRTSFRQEVAVWHKLDHPNVTKVRPIYASYVAVNIGRWLCFFSFFFPMFLLMLQLLCLKCFFKYFEF